jgi:hypothetical protein
MWTGRLRPRLPVSSAVQRELGARATQPSLRTATSLPVVDFWDRAMQ